MAAKPTDADRIAELEARIAASEEDARISRKYGANTPELVAFYREQEEKKARLKQKQARAYERRKLEAERQDRVDRHLATALLKADLIRVLVNRARRHPTDPDAIGCPVCGTPSPNAAGYLLDLVRRWHKNGPDALARLRGRVEYLPFAPDIICQSCREPMRVVLQLSPPADEEDPRRSPEFKALMAEIERERESDPR
jgi:hypothetical protein